LVAYAGVKQVSDKIWLVSFMQYDLGYFDKERDRVEPGPSPFMPDKVLTMCPEQGVNHVTGQDPSYRGVRCAFYSTMQDYSGPNHAKSTQGFRPSVASIICQ